MENEPKVKQEHLFVFDEELPPITPAMLAEMRAGFLGEPKIIKVGPNVLVGTVTNNEVEDVTKRQVKTMRDARGFHYEIFVDKDEVKRGAKEAALKYIDMLGNTQHIDVSDWELDKFKAKGILITDRRKINDVFFKLKQKATKKPKPKYVKASTIDKLMEPFKRQVFTGEDGHTKDQYVGFNKGYQDEIFNHERNIEREKRNIARLERIIKQNMDWIKEIDEKEAKQKPNAGKHPFVPQLKKLLKTGFFELDEKQVPGKIRLMTKPINKTFFSEKQKTNLMVPLGQFLVEVYPDRPFAFMAYKGKNNIISPGGRVHPHMGNGRDGYFCMGEGGVHYNDARKMNDFYGAMVAVWNTLANFDDRTEDGYEPLYRFEEAYKASLNKKEGK